jgi:hypothetical protein
MNILGISGKKQAGKNTAANYIHGVVLKQSSMIEDFDIDERGQLVIKTSVEGDVEHGVLDVTRKDATFIEYAHHNMWPHVKLYSFADGLKRLCIEFFGLSYEQGYGTDKDKNTPTKVDWEDIPTWKNSSLNKNRGAMTARELLQYFGTDVMRKMYNNVWVDHALSTIRSEKSSLAVIADVRFPNEVQAIKDAGGKVIRLTREFKDDSHSSENALDKDNYNWDNFDYVINNSSPEVLFKEIKKIYDRLGV